MNSYATHPSTSLQPNPVLCPVIILVLWSFIMMIWLYATRIPATKRLNIQYDPRKHLASHFEAQMPPEARWVADNYNHLMEQPTLFYAVALTLALINDRNNFNLTLAWLYVLLRIVHSLIQATINRVMWRFFVFILGSTLLLILAIRIAAILLFGGGNSI
ncbi:unnamed protein product [Didymodactylos carnosus]|uniref:MAPEG family protein n=1 Tax=Didymodactylos carnosus TaxID=1234261 RepID=A0A815XEP2_9BILA|nr:unnamed protein product [Didymodactylos carnosus]CAF1556752.1 unnamed protein product [Didymodactylos carnosus]CAF4230206.1 unnamed protein product [Didymodactylos carnosus]CAF4417957.1 unnamed protein product [Didymodactylos carnosus]